MENTNYLQEPPLINSFGSYISEDFFHQDILYPSGQTILVAGCGMRNLLRMLASENPACCIFSIDTDERNQAVIREDLSDGCFNNVQCLQADLFHLPFLDEYCDHVIIFMILEMFPNPLKMLGEFVRVLKPGGSLTVIAGDLGSVSFAPDSESGKKLLAAYNHLLINAEVNPNIGRTLAPLFRFNGMDVINVQTGMIYADSGEPDLANRFVKDFFISQIEFREHDLIQNQWIDPLTYKNGIDDLYKTAGFNGVFTYSYFKCKGVKI